MKADKKFTAFITKYALTQGIFKKIVEDCGGGMVATVGDAYTGMYHGEGREWHRSLQAAKSHAETMRQAKIVSLERQIEKLRVMEIEGPK